MSAPSPCRVSQWIVVDIYAFSQSPVEFHSELSWIFMSAPSPLSSFTLNCRGYLCVLPVPCGVSQWIVVDIYACSQSPVEFHSELSWIFNSSLSPLSSFTVNCRGCLWVLPVPCRVFTVNCRGHLLVLAVPCRVSQWFGVDIYGFSQSPVEFHSELSWIFMDSLSPLSSFTVNCRGYLWVIPVPCGVSQWIVVDIYGFSQSPVEFYSELSWIFMSAPSPLSSFTVNCRGCLWALPVRCRVSQWIVVDIFEYSQSPVEFHSELSWIFMSAPSPLSSFTVNCRGYLWVLPVPCRVSQWIVVDIYECSQSPVEFHSELSWIFMRAPSPLSSFTVNCRGYLWVLPVPCRVSQWIVVDIYECFQSPVEFHSELSWIFMSATSPLSSFTVNCRGYLCMLPVPCRVSKWIVVDIYACSQSPVEFHSELSWIFKSHSLRASDRFGHRKNRFCLNSYCWLLLVYET